jgi:RNA recognition motif-containing protein
MAPRDSRPAWQDAASRPTATKSRRGSTADSATLEEQCHRRKVFVGGLAHKTKMNHLREHFQRFGTVIDAVVLQWPDGRSRGFGYVTFADTASAQASLKLEHEIDGRQVDVKRAVPGTNKIFVGGLPQSASAGELREYFESFGIVSDAVVMMDPSTNRSRGFGFICFLPGQDGAAAVATALERYQSHRLRGKWIEVKSAAPPHRLGGNQAGEQDTSSTQSSTPPSHTPPPRHNINNAKGRGKGSPVGSPVQMQKAGLHDLYASVPPGLAAPPGLSPQTATLSLAACLEAPGDRQVKEAWGTASTDLQRSLAQLLSLHVSQAARSPGKEPLPDAEAFLNAAPAKLVRGATPVYPMKIEY